MSSEKKITKLMNLITDEGKHKSYQDFPTVLKNNFSDELRNINWNPNRLDVPRFLWLRQALNNIIPKTITDIGANTGFFTVELNQTYNASCIAYEPHAPHAEALSLIKDICDINGEKLKVKNVGVSLKDIDELEGGDLLIFLNVLHHAGDDYDSDKVKNIIDWKNYSLIYLESLSLKYEYMFFQLGNAWKGSAEKIYKDENFFAETINLLQNSGWKIESIGLIESFYGLPEYESFSLNGRIGENRGPKEIFGYRKIIRFLLNKLFFNVDYKFLNRPIYLCRSLKKTKL